MSKKHLVFIIILTISAMLLWILGEILIVAVFKLSGKASIFWTAFMIIAVIALSLWKGLKDDSNSRKW